MKILQKAAWLDLKRHFLVKDGTIEGWVRDDDGPIV